MLLSFIEIFVTEPEVKITKFRVDSDIKFLRSMNGTQLQKTSRPIEAKLYLVNMSYLKQKSTGMSTNIIPPSMEQKQNVQNMCFRRSNR